MRDSPECGPRRKDSQFELHELANGSDLREFEVGYTGLERGTGCTVTAADSDPIAPKEHSAIKDVLRKRPERHYGREEVEVQNDGTAPLSRLELFENPSQ